MSEERGEIARVTRKLFREAALDALESAGKKLVLSEIPIVGLFADAATVYDVFRFARDMIELRTQIKAATRFVNEGAHTLADLQVSRETQILPNMDAFVKFNMMIFSEAALEKRFGPAGEGQEYHHLIEQATRAAGDKAENTDDIVRIPTILHHAVTAYYVQKTKEFGGPTLRQWLADKPPAVRRAWGIEVLRRLKIIVE
jgi:hypothetical protein